MLKYKIVASVALALLVTGCNANDNASDNHNNRGENVGLNAPPTTETPNSPLNVNKVNYGRNNDFNTDNARNNNGMQTNNVRNVGNRTFDDNAFELSDDMANRVARLKEVRSANVLLTGNTVYVAAVLNDDEGGRVSRKVENKIADTVRSVDKSVDRVYVSTNPDFVDRINRYSNDVANGRPVNGFGQEFGELVNRVFPNAR